MSGLPAHAPASGFRPCAIVPVYNHEHAVRAVIDGLCASGLPCIVVDDGSEAGCARVLDDLVAARPGLTLLRRAVNGGKGAAVADGLRAALAAGYTHGLQVDADGQHAIADVARFLAAGAAQPRALVCGQPVFDASMPRSRYLFRYLTHALVWLNTLSLQVRDSMCGFRLYPLALVVPMLDEERPGQRMDFDIEVMVRLHWRGLPMVWLATRVTYPADGVSHFRLVLDNVLISRVHAKLFAGMLWRAPRILARRWGSARSAVLA
jgi:glycosyltransferase involved in cell wall biosynthesis